ncbi:MAG: branched-chain amino acid ABC transporter permease [Micromonosporaceae bacterium]|jgi:neutral amino acid transport system permease protein
MRKAAVILAALLGVAVVGTGVGTAWAQQEEGLQGNLRYEDEPLSGVVINVYDESGELVGTAESGPDGRWFVPVPGSATYRVELDESTLPEGLAALTGNVREPFVRPGSVGNVLYRIGPGERGQSASPPTSGSPPSPGTPTTPGGQQAQQPTPSDDPEQEGEVVTGRGTFERVVAYVYSGIHFGLIIALAALGLSLIFGTMGLINFSHGELVSFGAIVALLFNVVGLSGLTLSLVLAIPVAAAAAYLLRRLAGRGAAGWLADGRGARIVRPVATVVVYLVAAWALSLLFDAVGVTDWRLPLVAAVPVAVAAGALFGYLQDRYFWGWLRRRGTGLIAMMIISIGVALALRNLYLYFIGPGRRAYAQYAVQRPIEVGPLVVTPKTLVTDGIALVVLIAVALALILTRIGKAIRAVADNPTLAAAAGINVDKVIRLVWAAGAGLAALAGVFLAIHETVNYLMGFQMLLLIFAAVVVGGLGTAFGTIVGGLIIGLLIQVSTMWVPNEFKYVVALAALIVVLLVRPQGILGRRVRVG